MGIYVENMEAYIGIETAAFESLEHSLTIETDIEKINRTIEGGQDPVQSYIIADGIPKNVPDFEQEQRNYILDDPDILFVAEYIIEQNFIGVLVVWEDYKDSTHYEVFKKNVFKSEGDFERILFLTKKDLKEESKNYIDYVKNTLGFNRVNEDKLIIILDDFIKKDRIYEYKIKAAKVPSRPNEVDYDLILESKGLLSKYTVNKNANLFSFGKSFYSNEKMTWILPLINENLKYFGEETARNTIGELLNVSTNPEVYVVNDASYVQNILIECISLFDIKSTYEHIINLLGGLPEVFVSIFLESIDVEKNDFSLDKFRDLVRSEIPVFNLLLSVVESAKALEKESLLPLNLPLESGSRSLLTIQDISDVLDFVNRIYVSILISQSKEALAEIRLFEQQLQEETASEVINTTINTVLEQISPTSNEQTITSNIDNITTSVVNQLFGTTEQTTTPKQTTTPEQAEGVKTTLEEIGINIAKLFNP